MAMNLWVPAVLQNPTRQEAPKGQLDDDERWEVLVLRQDHFDEVVPNIYSRPADQYISAHTDQSHLLGETSDILSLTLGSAGVFFLCSEIRKMVL